MQRQVIAAGHLPLFVLSVVQTHPRAVANCGNVDPVTVAVVAFVTVAMSCFLKKIRLRISGVCVT